MGATVLLAQRRICAWDSPTGALKLAAMRIAKPLLLVTTPVGVLWGLLEAYRLAGGLVILMAALVGTLAVAAATVVATVRRESAAERLTHPNDSKKEAY
jgi:hypothetical protein